MRTSGRTAFRRPRRRCRRRRAMLCPAGRPGPGRQRHLGQRPARARPPAAVDHRPQRGRVAADGRFRSRPDDRVQRLHLQLPGPARPAAGARAPVLLDLGHRGDRQGLRRVGHRLRREVPRHVRVRDRRARDRPADPGPRPARHQAALPRPDRRPAAVRLDPAGPARRRRHRHLDRPHRAGALHELPLDRAAAAHHPERRAQAAAGDRARRRSRTGAAPTTSTGNRASPATRIGPR